jgi:hypothetical protein
MTAIVTITLNPAVDLSTAVERIVPVHKLRGTSQRRDPGGGGINVARVVSRLGGDVSAIYLAGGAMGGLLRRLLDGEGIAGRARISSSTRRLRASNTASSCPARALPSTNGSRAWRRSRASIPFRAIWSPAAACPMACPTTSMRSWRGSPNPAAPA